jgi:hypothetical protein
VVRKDLGLATLWVITEKTVFSKSILPSPDSVKPVEVKKKAEPVVKIEKLSNYKVPPPGKFWEKFPKNELPSVPACSVNVPLMRKLLNEEKSKLKVSAYERMMKSLDNLEKGASLAQKGPLPACFVPNAESAYNYGESVTDTVAAWVVKKFVSGPFNDPPLKNFRVNPLAAIDQGTKIRPIMDVSAPKGSSLNDNMNDLELEKVFMSTAQRFSYSLYDCRENAIMSKFDFVDAFKIVPAKIKDLHLQGFFWLNKFFVESRQIFGARTSVPNFDILANSVKTLAEIDLNIPCRYFHRTLDDIPLVAPNYNNWCVKFSNRLIELCEKCNIPLAVSCPKNEKAFVCSSYGKVLGIFFDSKTLCWKLPEEKHCKYLRIVCDVLMKNCATLKEMQSVMGIFNNVCLFAPFLRGFKFNLNNFVKSLMEKDGSLSLPKLAQDELWIFANFLNRGNIWHPIVAKYHYPPLSAYHVVTDASGKFMEAGTGCGHVILNYDNEIIFAFQFLWPSAEFLLMKDSKGSLYSNKTCCLEFIGVLIPFILKPELLRNKYVIVSVDNIACYFGWLNRNVPNDACASIMIRTLHVLSGLLACVIHFEHLPRMSTETACLVDRLSRVSTSTEEDKCLLARFQHDVVRLAPLWEWLCDPQEDWDLPRRIVNVVKRTLYE